jgi:hypothetical protein
MYMGRDSGVPGRALRCQMGLGLLGLVNISLADLGRPFCLTVNLEVLRQAAGLRQAPSRGLA